MTGPTTTAAPESPAAPPAGAERSVVAHVSQLADRQPQHARVADVDLVVVRVDGALSVLYGRCTHRQALLANGRVEGARIVCAAHGWDYECATGRCGFDASEAVQRFDVWQDGDEAWVDAAQVRRWRADTPRDFHDDELDP